MSQQLLTLKGRLKNFQVDPKDAELVLQLQEFKDQFAENILYAASGLQLGLQISGKSASSTQTARQMILHLQKVEKTISRLHVDVSAQTSNDPDPYARITWDTTMAENASSQCIISYKSSPQRQQITVALYEIYTVFSNANSVIDALQENHNDVSRLVFLIASAFKKILDSYIE